MAPRIVPPLDQEMWAGVSYRQALLGVAVLGGSALLVGWLTSSAISGITGLPHWRLPMWSMIRA